ncbi:MAG: YaaA family protein [Campylobacter sp.]
MKILFSPSEAKTALLTNQPISKGKFIFPNLYEKRLQIINHYDSFLQNSTTNEISKLFGIKNLQDDENLRQSVLKRQTAKAVLRYDGVAYKHLKYKSLDEKAQKFIDDNVLIFSNLFGPILAGNFLPEYKLKQGEKINDLDIENFYKLEFSSAIDKWLDEDIIDLRAEFYQKFYEPKRAFTTFKFIKNGKVVSHYAKAYRGVILREIAQKNICDTKDLGALNIENLRLIDVKQIGLKSEFLLEIG